MSSHPVQQTMLVSKSGDSGSFHPGSEPATMLTGSLALRVLLFCLLNLNLSLEKPDCCLPDDAAACVCLTPVVCCPQQSYQSAAAAEEKEPIKNRVLSGRLNAERQQGGTDRKITQEVDGREATVQDCPPLAPQLEVQGGAAETLIVPITSEDFHLLAPPPQHFSPATPPLTPPVSCCRD